MFFITAVYSCSNKVPLNTRCFGYFATLMEAREAVEENRCNMQEDFYNFIVIESGNTGIHPVLKQLYWYEWDGDNWKECDKPNFSIGTINYAIG